MTYIFMNFNFSFASDLFVWWGRIINRIGNNIIFSQDTYFLAGFHYGILSSLLLICIIWSFKSWNSLALFLRIDSKKLFCLWSISYLC